MQRNIFIILLAAMLLAGCEFQSYEEYGIDPYDGALQFTRVEKKAEWHNRFDHAAVTFDNKLWILGGYNPGEVRNDTYYEDVWSSVDGVQWELVNDNAPWLGRRGHAVVAFDDGNGEAMYLAGGYSVDESTGYRQYCNDVWRSDDGITWTQIKERTYAELDSLDTWFPRSDHAMVVANHGGTDYIYIIGGRTQLEDHNGTYAQEYFNDVWRSEDGITWEQLDNNNFGRRASHAAAVDPATGTIYIQGGRHGVIFEADGNASYPIEKWNWLWSSPDGRNWTADYDPAVDSSFLSRSEHQMIFYDNTLWVFPGSTTSTMHYMFGEPYHYPTWRVDGGKLWSIDSRGSDLKGRHSYGIARFDDKIWFLGGFTSFRGQNNDVWTAEQ
ncbi:MAG: hypothetical protein P1P82_14155 [Bacteroidales bacterium]|nr:hypothetical protein [Bacteroidales bacterium]MDT8432632.1 hypothetical protein [Bacteroidales bacterium]